MRFRRVLSALLRKRKASHEGIFFVAGAGRGHLAPHGELLVANKVRIVSVFDFFGVQSGVLVSPWKTRFFENYHVFGGQKGPPETPE